MYEYMKCMNDDECLKIKIVMLLHHLLLVCTFYHCRLHDDLTVT